MNKRNEITLDTKVHIDVSMRNKEVSIESAREIYNPVNGEYESVDENKNYIHYEKDNDLQIKFIRMKNGQTKFKFEVIFGDIKK
jgi:hypothetical protein